MRGGSAYGSRSGRENGEEMRAGERMEIGGGGGGSKSRGRSKDRSKGRSKGRSWRCYNRSEF